MNLMPDPVSDPDPELAHARLKSLEHERQCLQDQLSALLEEIALLEAQLEAQPRVCTRSRSDAQLAALLSDIDEQLDRCEQERQIIAKCTERRRRCGVRSERRLQLIAEERETLSNLFVAGVQLHDAEDLDQARAAILEVVINLIGCEEVGVFERDRRRATCCYRLTGSLGLNAARSGDLSVHRGFIGERLVSGETFISSESPLELNGDLADGLSVCMPLVAAGEVVGVLLMYGLLAHKSGLTSLDLELLELMREHGGGASPAPSRRRGAGARAPPGPRHSCEGPRRYAAA